MKELKSCRCGNIYLARYDADHNGIKNTYVYCDICGRRESIYTWNNRKDIDKQAAEIERLKAKAAELEQREAMLRESCLMFRNYLYALDGCDDDYLPVEIVDLYNKAIELNEKALKNEG